MTLIYRHSKGAEIHQTRGRMQPYCVRYGDKIWGFDAEYHSALVRLAKTVQDTAMEASLKYDNITKRVPKERRHREVVA